MVGASEVSVTATATSIELENNHGNGYSSDSLGRQSKSDAATLSQLGKKPVLKRRFGLISTISFSCLVINCWGGVFQVLNVGLLNGGPAGSFWGWIVVWCGLFATFACLAELSSIAPTSGGQYHWVSLLAPASSQPLFSYITGWLTTLGWLSGVTSTVYISGTLIQALIQFVQPAYEPQLWQGTLLVYAVLALCAVVTINLVYLAPEKASAETVFTLFINGGGWPTTGLSFMVGLQGWAFANIGADSAVHMSEEVQNAAVVVPRSIIFSLLLNFLTGTGMLLATLFCIPDPNGLLALGLQYPFTQIFLQSTGSVAGSAIMIAVVIFNEVGLNIANVATASRMIWSFSRDRGIPGWRFVSRVSPRSSIPVVAIGVVITFAVLVALISIGSAVAFNDVLSLTIDSLFGSYLVVCTLLLWRRCQGRIKLPSELRSLHEASKESPAGRSKYEHGPRPGAEGYLVWGPFHMRGRFGIAVNTFACLYMVMIIFFSVWPPGTPTTAVGMNYAIVVFAAVAMVGLVYYLAWAHKTYKGPNMEVSI